MPFFAPWLQAPDYLGASEAGTRAGLSIAQMIQDAREHAAQLKLQRDEMNSRSSEAANALAQSGGLRSRELDQQKSQDDAANALRAESLKQEALYQNQSNQNYTDSVSARTALDQARENALNNKRPFANTAGGLMQQDANGNWNLVPGSQKPAPQQKPANLGTVRVPADGADMTKGTIDVPINSPLYQKWAALSPTVTKGPDITHWFSPNTPGPDVTNAPPTLSAFMQSSRNFPSDGSAASALTAPTSTGFTTVAPAVNALKPQSFIGTPGGQNGFDPRATGFTAGIAPAPSKAPRIFTDKSGTQYIYSGNAADPMSDKNPNVWNAVNQPDSGPTADAPASSDLETPPDN